MTAIDTYLRLESTGQWRQDGAEPQEVLVSFGNATLVLSDFSDSPLAHWALVAIRRLSLTDGVATYAPDGEATETLEIDDPEMIEAIAQVSRLRPVSEKPRKWGRVLALVLLLGAVGYAGSVAPAKLRGQALEMTTKDSARQLGWQMLEALDLQVCRSAGVDNTLLSLGKLSFPKGGYTIQVTRNGPAGASFPGGLILVNEAALQQMTTPTQLVRWVQKQAENRPPLDQVFEAPPLKDIFTYVTTGGLPAGSLKTSAETVLAATRRDLEALPDSDGSAGGLSAPDWANLQKICQE